MAEDLPRVLAGVGPGQQVEHRQPDIVARHDDEDDLNKGGELVGDHPLIAQVAEGGRNVERQDGDDDLAHDGQNDVLELAEEITGQLAVGPRCRQTHEDAEHQCAHNAHDLGDVQLKHHLRQLTQTGHLGIDGQMRDERIARAGAHEGRADRGGVGDDDGNAQQPGGIFAQPGDGRRDEADDDQRHTEGDQLAHDVLQRHHNFHGSQREDLPQQHADNDAQQQPERKTVQ